MGGDGVHISFGGWLSLLATDQADVVAWTDSRRGTLDNGKQDVFFSEVLRP